MKFLEFKSNTMGDIIKLWGTEWETINKEKIEEFKRLLIPMGFKVENDNELSQCLFALEEEGVIDIKFIDDTAQIKRKIQYG